MRGQGRESRGSKERLHRHGIDSSSWLGALRAAEWPWGGLSFGKAAIGHNYFAFGPSAVVFTEASNPVFETDSAIFFGSVFEGS